MFYVYTLTDPRDGAVFYVGKGKGDRVSAHERDAQRGKPGAKCDRIREIWAAGFQVVRSEVARYRRETDALRAEEQLISQIGLSALTNIAPGGRGGRHKVKPMRWTPALLRKIAPSLRGAIERMNGGDGRLYTGDIDVTTHVHDVIAMLRREAGDDMLREHAGVSFA